MYTRSLPDSLALAGWSDDAKDAMLDNPDYFIWWYTVKSVGLAALAYYVGKEHGRGRK